MPVSATSPITPAAKKLTAQAQNPLIILFNQVFNNASILDTAKQKIAKFEQHSQVIKRLETTDKDGVTDEMYKPKTIGDVTVNLMVFKLKNGLKGFWIEFSKTSSEFTEEQADELDELLADSSLMNSAGEFSLKSGACEVIKGKLRLTLTLLPDDDEGTILLFGDELGKRIIDAKKSNRNPTKRI